MLKDLYIAEKPSVAQEFAKALKIKVMRKDGYLEGENHLITWCVGHLVTMSYPDAYHIKMKQWKEDTLPFLPKKFKYEVIKSVAKQFNIVKTLLNRSDIRVIYVCTDSGREGEYIYRLVAQEAKLAKEVDQRRVWIDSQTEDEIKRGIKEAKPLSNYDNLSSSAYLRAKEDYLMGINFSRIISIKYGLALNNFLKTKKWSAISVGRVMTCVQGMVVKREREIREFVKTPFYRLNTGIGSGENVIQAEFKASESSKYYNTNLLYKDNGFLDKNIAIKEIENLVGGRDSIQDDGNWQSNVSKGEELEATIISMERKRENKNPPLLYNLAELQNDCARIFKISPDKTLEIMQDLYEKKLVTYPRTDARVLSTAVAKEIHKNINGLINLIETSHFIKEILENQSYKNIIKSRYVNDKQITDHYAIIPTGQAINSLEKLPSINKKIYMLIVRRFISIFYPPARYRKTSINFLIKDENFISNFKFLEDEGYLKVIDFNKGKSDKDSQEIDINFIDFISKLRKGSKLFVKDFTIKEGETSPPKRYNSGTLILAMENAGQLIEDEELRSHIKGSGIGTSATRAEILKKLIKINYLSLNNKTQIITPTLQGELVYDIVNVSARSLLNPELTASWEKGLTLVANGQITEDEYMHKLENFVATRVNNIKSNNYNKYIEKSFNKLKKVY